MCIVLSQRSAFLLLTATTVTTTTTTTIRVICASAAAMSTAPARTTNNNNDSSSKQGGALIFLHGLGDSPAGWSSLEQQLPRIQPRLANIQYVFPAAPTIPIAINGNARMTGWFDLYDWPIEVGATDDRVQKLQSVATIQREVETLRAKGIDKIVVGGFSQGGAVALLAAYHPQHAISSLAGCAALSAWLTLVDDFSSNAASNKDTPLFWAHGRYDDKVLFQHQAVGVEKMKESGVVDIDARQYSIGHESDPNEIVALAGFLDKVIFGDSKSNGDSEL